MWPFYLVVCRLYHTDPDLALYDKTTISTGQVTPGSKAEEMQADGSDSVACSPRNVPGQTRENFQQHPEAIPVD